MSSNEGNTTFTVTTAPPSTSTSAPPSGDAPWPPPDEHVWLTFPPFTQPPPGVTLIPFSAFKPAGIVQAAEGEQERDALGIPTVALRVHHDLTAMEKRKRKKTVRVDASGAPRRTLWYEEWADGEELRRTAGAIDPSIPRIDRLHQASYDFKNGRSLASNQDISQLWDRWRLYIGLISGLQSPASRKKDAAIRDAFAAAAEAPGDDDDDDDEEEMPATRPPKAAKVVVADDGGKPMPLPESAPKPGVTEEQRQQRREYYREVRDTKMDRFLNDPEKAVKIFLSGYYRDRGMSYSEKYCRDGPILIAFFLNFLLRNRVFPESEKDLRKAVAVTELAKKELPHSFVVSRAIPDDFSAGAEILFGRMTDRGVWPALGDDSSEDNSNDTPDAKRQKTDGAPSATAILQEAAGPSEIEVVTADTVREMEEEAKDVIADADADASGWGAPSGSWGDANAAWSASGDASLWDTTPKANPLNALLGPTVLPLTHTTGVIELSTRRVKAVVPPRAPKKASPKKSGSGGLPGGPSADAVERDLEARFAQVVLGPWEEWDLYDKADVTKPVILPDSRGPVIREEDGAAGPTPPGTPPHNPFKDEIALLVLPATAETLWVGTGIQATWIQLARADTSVPMEVDDPNAHAARRKRAGAPGEPAEPTKFWYMEQVMAVLPSFHTEMVPLPTTADVFGPEED